MYMISLINTNGIFNSAGDKPNYTELIHISRRRCFLSCLFDESGRMDVYII